MCEEDRVRSEIVAAFDLCQVQVYGLREVDVTFVRNRKSIASHDPEFVFLTAASTEYHE